MVQLWISFSYSSFTQYLILFKTYRTRVCKNIQNIQNTTQISKKSKTQQKKWAKNMNRQLTKYKMAKKKKKSRCSNPSITKEMQIKKRYNIIPYGKNFIALIVLIVSLLQLLVRFTEEQVLTHIADKNKDLCRFLEDTLSIQGDVPKNSYPIVY